MSEKGTIDYGDRVRVVYMSAPQLEIVGTVTRMPSDVGDSWGVLRDDGTTVFFMRYEIMYKLEGGDE